METICDVLGVISAGAEKPTHIMYRANLSWPVSQDCIRSLEEQGFIVSTLTRGKLVYHLTQKGYILLSQFVTLRDEISLPTIT